MVMRITGLSSGMDIDSIVSDLMKTERMPLQTMKQKNDLYSYQMDLYREINSKLSSFRSLMNDMRFSSSLSLTKATSSSSAVSVSSSANAPSSTHTIEVLGLASGAVKTSNAAVSDVGLAGSAGPVLNIATGSNDKFNVTLDGVTRSITLNAGAYDLNGLITEVQSKLDTAFGANKITVNNDGSGNLMFNPVGMSVPQITLGAVSGNNGLTDLGFVDKQSLKININDTINNISTKFSTDMDTSGDFYVNGQKITYTNTDSIQSIMNKVNSSSAGVSMSYDAVSDRFTFTSKTLGSTAQVKLEAGTGNFLNAIKTDNIIVSGSDTQVKIDGVTSFRSSNTFTIDGITYNVKEKTTDPVTVSVDKDVDAIVDKVKKFVESYNDIVGLMSKRTSEERFRNYMPLTDDQKKAMSETEIKLWDDKVKSGLLRNDSILKETNNTLRSMIIKEVDNVPVAFNTMQKIGLNTARMIPGSYDPESVGKIVIDEKKLRDALTQDSGAVINLFTAQSLTTPPTESQKGVAQSIYDAVNNSINRLIDKAGRVGGSYSDITSTLGSQYSKLQLKMNSLESTLSKKEDYYYKRFSTMEQAIAKGNSTMSWLSSQLQ